MVMVAVSGVTNHHSVKSGSQDTGLASLRGVCRGELESGFQGP